MAKNNTMRSNGSSPGGWGEEAPGDAAEARRRFIPRRLGRGIRARARVIIIGSSPGGWGEAGHALDEFAAFRFIPRRLGRGRSMPASTGTRSVHPQAAGERLHRPHRRCGNDGSSPGGWGEGTDHGRPDRGVRFIPRRLGRGRARGPRRTRCSVHPQAAGERCASVISIAGPYGSSPGGWGEGRPRRAHPAVRRFIPRRLGRGSRRSTRRRRGSVHPQAAGERAWTSMPDTAEPGSSPGGWGEADVALHIGGARRFIPRRLGRGDMHPQR